jgi:hypothetical protein
MYDSTAANECAFESRMKYPEGGKRLKESAAEE